MYPIHARAHAFMQVRDGANVNCHRLDFLIILILNTRYVQQ